MDQSTTVLFGLPGVRVDRVSTDDVGVRQVEFFTDDERAAACPSCGVVSTSVKGMRSPGRRIFHTEMVQ